MPNIKHTGFLLQHMLLQTQLDEDAKILKGLELFGYFVADIYARFEFPIGAEAAAGS